ncbi:NADPH-dependent FMN reductase [Pedobacter hartonius]|uniref:NAD(P)H-dependent FMN reductase n=1 Tax=Pedobacter hartonius TaxID=425514 RepID=A0A1H4HCX4_9SPHI|nr:NAD(P)H-dependent oxidoreductase [Pedobacter hartonius]SEB19526.1 NAD(P)H-dependent FMN reductase [Pedobacter hartonius]
MDKLLIISSTVRPGRKGPIIASWITDLAKESGQFEVEMIDLGELKLPLMDEPNHPSMKKYEHEHTKKWSAKIDVADAFIFVTGEYNFGYPAPLRNALEYLYQEWNYKAAGVVSYGGISAGTRAAKALKDDLATFKIVPLYEAVNIPFFTERINEEDIFEPAETTSRIAAAMLKELVRWTKGLKTIKADV